MAASLNRLAARQMPFEIRLGRVGAFGPRDAATLWLGLEPRGARSVAELAAAVAEALPPRLSDGPPEADYRPHLTLCRRAPRAVRADLARGVGMGRPIGWQADCLRLVRSEPFGRAVRHVTIVEFPLLGA